MYPFAYIQSFEVTSYYMCSLVYIPEYFCTSNCLFFEEETVAYPVLSQVGLYHLGPECLI